MTLQSGPAFLKAICWDNIVLPEPGVPANTVKLPVGSPPERISSRLRTPVEIRSCALLAFISALDSFFRVQAMKELPEACENQARARVSRSSTHDANTSLKSRQLFFRRHPRAQSETLQVP